MQSERELFLAKELKKYQKGFDIVMCQFDRFDPSTRTDIDKQLKKIDL